MSPMGKGLIHNSYAEKCESVLSSLKDGTVTSARLEAWKTFRKKEPLVGKSSLKNSGLLKVLPFKEMDTDSSYHRKDSFPATTRMWNLSALDQKGSLPPHLHKMAVKSLSNLAHISPLFSLGIAMMSHSKVIMVEAGKQKRSFIRLSHSIPVKVFTHSYFLIFVSKGAHLDFYEEQDSEGFSNSLIHFILDKGAKVTHYHTQSKGSGMHLSQLKVDLLTKADYRRYHLSLGSENCFREEIFADLKGVGSNVSLFGVHSTKGSKKSEHLLRVVHSASKTTSSQFYRGLLMERSRASFQGSIIIEKNCSEVDGEQQSSSLLLSPDARMYNEPSLDIFSQDVSCSHGAAIGQVDEPSLFYLNSRGVSRKEGEKLICKGFALQALLGMPDESARESFRGKLIEDLGG